MLAEICLMRLRTRVRTAARADAMTVTDRFVPIALSRDRAAGGVRPA